MPTDLPRYLHGSKELRDLLYDGPQPSNAAEALAWCSAAVRMLEHHLSIFPQYWTAADRNVCEAIGMKALEVARRFCLGVADEIDPRREEYPGPDGGKVLVNVRLLAERLRGQNAPPPVAAAAGASSAPEQIDKIAQAIAMVIEAQKRGNKPIQTEIAKAVGVHRSTLARDGRFRAAYKAAKQPNVAPPRPGTKGEEGVEAEDD
jgi:hypothetical protein